jgi:hypothetical protein
MAKIFIYIFCDRQECESRVSMPYLEDQSGVGLSRQEIATRAIQDFGWFYDGLDDDNKAKLRCSKAVHGI